MEKRDNYENNNIVYDINNEEGIKCKNYELCKIVLPKLWKANYLCINCDMMFGGILEIKDTIECPICYEYKKGISQPRCNHFICIDCFKRCYYIDTNGEPIFPYPDNINDEYLEDINNTKWNIDYPLIKLYNEEYDKWEYNREKKYDNEKYLRICPICRK